MAVNIGDIELPALSGEEVLHELRMCTIKCYSDETASQFYSQMMIEYSSRNVYFANTENDYAPNAKKG